LQKRHIILRRLLIEATPYQKEPTQENFTNQTRLIKKTYRQTRHVSVCRQCISCATWCLARLRIQKGPTKETYTCRKRPPKQTYRQRRHVSVCRQSIPTCHYAFGTLTHSKKTYKIDLYPSKETHQINLLTNDICVTVQAVYLMCHLAFGTLTMFFAAHMYVIFLPAQYDKACMQETWRACM